MKKRKYYLFIVLMLFICLPLFLISSHHVRAAEINVEGLQASQATITNSQGQVISNNSSLSNDDDYTVSWHWKVPNGTIIHNGDTAHFYIPNNVVVTHNLSFNIIDKKGKVVGVATVTAGSHEGTITFNNTLSHDNYDESGTLYMNVKGEQTTPNKYNWMLEKEGYIDKSDIIDGKPQYITWTIYVNPKSIACHDIKIDDQVDNNQIIVPNSVTINTGSFGNSNNFIPSGSFNGADINATNKQLKINIAQCHQTIKITYQTKIDSYNKNNVNIYNNVVHYQINGSSSQQASSYVKYGGGGTATGYEGQVQLIKKDATTKKTLAGAVFELMNGQGQVIQTNLITNAQGQINLKLLPGAYAFIETKAPQGYVLNSTPHYFTIMNGNSTIVKLIVTDTKAKTNSLSISSSISSSKKSLSSSSIVPSSSSNKNSSSSVVIPVKSSISSNKATTSSTSNKNNLSSDEASSNNLSSSQLSSVLSIQAHDNLSSSKLSSTINNSSQNSKIIIVDQSSHHNQYNSKTVKNNKLPQTSDNNKQLIPVVGVMLINISILVGILC